MLFKSVTIHDKKTLEPYLRHNKYDVCDFSFSNVFIWRNYFKVSYTIHKGFLIIITSASNGIPHFCMPFHKDNCHAGLKEIFDDMMAYCKQTKVPFRMTGLTPEMLEDLKPVLPEGFVVPESSLCDYVYASEDLINLKGKKFHAKRNHINKFDSLYSYEYIDVTPDNVELCRDVLKIWAQENNSDDPKIRYEMEAVEDAINHFGELGLKGGVLLVDEKPVAFSMGQPLNNKTFAVHIEKALYNIHGAYAKINREFAARNCGDYIYINREEDLGIEGLRKAKMSYNPVRLLYKHIGYIAEQEITR